MIRAVWAAACCLFALVVAPALALGAFSVPAIQGHVTDTAGVLSAEERADLEGRLNGYMDRDGLEMAVLVARSLEGETIEDVAYRTFNGWHVGRPKLDDGVLLVIAPAERRVRIETGKGIGGRLTDLQASDIIEQRIVPALGAGRYHDAVAAGTDGIAAVLGAAGEARPVSPPFSPPAALVAAAILVLLLVGAGVLRFFGGWPFFPGGGWPGRGGGPWMGGGGSGGYSGGGGRSGGGGASGSW